MNRFLVWMYLRKRLHRQIRPRASIRMRYGCRRFSIGAIEWLTGE